MTNPPGPAAAGPPPEHPAAVPGGPSTFDPVAVIRSRPYLTALVLAAILGIPISIVAYGFLALVSQIQQYLFQDLPGHIFDGAAPAWWPVVNTSLLPSSVIQGCLSSYFLPMPSPRFVNETSRLRGITLL